MSRRTSSDLLSIVLATALLAGAPFAAASAQDQSSDPPASEQQEDSGSQGEPDQQKQQEGQSPEENSVQLKIVQLEHISYGELRNMVRLHQTNLFSERTGELAGERVHVSHDGESNTLFIRAPKERLDKIEQFVSRLDVPAGELPKEIEFGGGAIAKHVSPQVGDRALRVLGQLDYPVAMQNFGGRQFLVIRSDQQAVRDEITQVIECFAQDEQDKKQQQQQQQQGAGNSESGAGEPSSDR